MVRREIRKKGGILVCPVRRGRRSWDDKVGVERATKSEVPVSGQRKGRQVEEQCRLTQPKY